MKKLKQKYITIISNDAELFGKIAKLTDRQPSTLSRWLRENSIDLTIMSVLELLAESTGDAISELTENK